MEKMRQKKKTNLRKELPFHLMLLPGVIFTIIFCYVPMVGMKIAFQKFIPAKGFFGDQKWIGFDNFTYLINMPGAMAALRNTIVIVTAVHAATDTNPVSWSPKSLNPPP